MRLPPKVHEKNGRYYYVHANKWTKLTRTDEGESALYLALHELTADKPATLGQVMNLYVAKGMSELRVSTRKRYLGSMDRLRHHFGHMRVGTLKPTHVAQFLEGRKKDGAGVTGNRERAVLSSIHEFGMRNGWVDANPCRGVRRNKEKPRQRYVTDAEFLEAFNAATEPFQDFLCIALLTGARQGDVRSWGRSVASKAGLSYRESKTGKKREVEWSGALRYFVDRALARSKGCDTLLVNKFGQPWGEWALQSQMRRLPGKWQLRDLRAKAATDATHNILGHQGSMWKVYQRQQSTKPLR